MEALTSPLDAPPSERSLCAALARAESVKHACAAVVEWLSDDPRLMPSIYLERGGRLRCQAVTGYWQVFDGMPPGVGVIGTTFVRESPTVVADATDSGDYLAAVPSVRGEACVPVWFEGTVIGVLNVESETTLAGDIVTTLERGAALLGWRIEQLGGLPIESRPQRLARHVTALAGLSDARAIGEEVVRAACDVAGMQSAMLLLGDGGSLALGGAHGPHTQRLTALDARTREVIAGWVDAVTSVYSIGEASGRGFAGHEKLRAAGAAAIVAVPVHVPAERDGVLLLVDGSAIALDTDDIELVELLAAQAGSALATAAAIGELHERAARDPLTQLGHHATFVDALACACEADPPVPFAVLVIDIDRFKAVNDRHGHRAGDELLVRCAQTLQRHLRSGDRLYRIGGDEFAALVRDVDDAKAMAVAQALRVAVAGHAGPTISVGVAVHDRRESQGALFARADAALYEVKRAGRDQVTLG